MDSGAGAAGIEHDPIEGPAEIEGTRRLCYDRRICGYLRRQLVVHVAGTVAVHAVAEVVHMVAVVRSLC